MNPKDVTMESVAGALGLRFDAAKHSLLMAKRNALIEAAKATLRLAGSTQSNDMRIEYYGHIATLKNMATELDAEIEAMMKGKQ